MRRAADREFNGESMSAWLAFLEGAINCFDFSRKPDQLQRYSRSHTCF
jgi:hypothetical protein